jgi:hypothetical protein
LGYPCESWHSALKKVCNSYHRIEGMRLNLTAHRPQRTVAVIANSVRNPSVTCLSAPNRGERQLAILANAH